MGRYWKVVVISLYWMMVAMSHADGVASVAHGEQLTDNMENPGYAEKPAWFKSSFLDIREDIEDAAKQHKRVMLYFYQDGCPYCKKLLQYNYANREIAERSQRHFDTIAINMWGDREVVNLEGEEVTEKQFAEQMKIMFTPTILMLGEKGQVILRINGYYYPDKFLSALKYVSGKKEGEISFRDFYMRQHKKASGKLHIADHFLQPPYDLRAARRASGKPLLVMFEHAQCLTCDELHNDILKRKESLQEMVKLDIVLLDMWSKSKLTTPDGRRLAAAEWTRELNILHSPSFVFFDNTGLEIFRAEAYLKAFHIQGIMGYVSSGAYKKQPNFQRWLSARADALEASGIHVELWK